MTPVSLPIDLNQAVVCTPPRGNEVPHTGTVDAIIIRITEEPDHITRLYDPADLWSIADWIAARKQFLQDEIDALPDLEKQLIQ